MSEIADEIKLEIRKQKIIDEFNALKNEGKDIRSWRSITGHAFIGRVTRLKESYENRIGDKMPMSDFLITYLGFDEFKPLNQDARLERRRQKIVNRLNEYVQENGSIYGWRQNSMKRVIEILKRDFQAQEGREISIEEFFSNYLGFEYDFKYANFKEKMSMISKYADENGCIDSLRTAVNNKEAPDMLLSFLSRRASKIGISEFDYVLLVTDYHFSTGFIQGNYVDYVKNLFWETFPDGKASLLASDHVILGRKLRRLSQNSLLQEETRQDIVEKIFGMTVDGLYKDKDRKPTPEEEIVKELKEFAGENGDVAGLNSKNRQLYNRMFNILRGETPQMFLERHGLTNSNSSSNKSSRFSFVETTYETRKAELFPIRDQIIADGGYDFDNMTEVQIYNAKLEIAKKTIEAYTKMGLYRYSNEFYNGNSPVNEDSVEAEPLEDEIADESLPEQPELLGLPTQEESLQTRASSLQEFLQKKYDNELGISQPVVEDTEGQVQ